MERQGEQLELLELLLPMSLLAQGAAEVEADTDRQAEPVETAVRLVVELVVAEAALLAELVEWVAGER